MRPDELENKFADILNNIGNYALIKNQGKVPYMIYDIANQGYLLVEEDLEKLIALLLKRNVKVVNTVEEVQNPDFVRYVMKWDEEKKTFVKVPIK